MLFLKRRRGRKALAFFSETQTTVTNGDPELRHANSPCGLTQRAVACLGLLTPKRASRQTAESPTPKRFCPHRWVLSPTGEVTALQQLLNALSRVSPVSKEHPNCCIFGLNKFTYLRYRNLDQDPLFFLKPWPLYARAF